MAYSLVHAGTVAAGTTGTALTPACTATTAGNLLVLVHAVYAANGNVVSAPAGWLRAASCTGSASVAFATTIWYYPACPAGITAAALSWTATTVWSEAQILEFHDQNGTNPAPLDVAGSISSDVFTPVPIATASAVAAAGELAVAAAAMYYSSATSATFTPGAGFTAAGSYGNGVSQVGHVSHDYALSAGTGTVTDNVAFTGGASTYFAGAIATFKPASAGAAAPARLLTQRTPLRMPAGAMSRASYT